MATGTGELLAVYETEEQARQAVEAARAAGAPAGGIRVADRRDDVEALRAEMRDETNNSVVAPYAGLIAQKEAAKAGGVAMTIGAIVGAIVFLPLALLNMGNLAVGGRLIIAILVGAATGATAVYVIAAIAGRGPARRLAAERGVTVRVASTDPQVVHALEDARPIRLDVVASDGQIDVRTLDTEDEHTSGGATEQVTDTLKHPEGNWQQNS